MNSAKESILKINFLDGMINVKNIDGNKIRIDEKSYKNLFFSAFDM